MKRNIITIATGKRLYIDLAQNLIRSFLLWHADSDIEFYLVTDLPDVVDKHLLKQVNLKVIKPGELGKGFTPKLFLDKLAPIGQSLFIDSDCLVYGKLDFVFERFKGKTVSVIGKYILDGEWFGNIKEICTKFKVPHLPKFNGGVYYLENGEEARSIYETARNLEAQYDEIGFQRLRNRPNDEVIMALAMQLHGQSPIEEDGTIMGEFVNFQSGFKSDIFKGKAILYNKPNHAKYQSSWPLNIGKPVIVHFLGDHTTIYPYTTIVKQLKLADKKLSPTLIKLITFFLFEIPWRIKTSFKDYVRPVYRLVFGIRQMKKSERIID